MKEDGDSDGELKLEDLASCKRATRDLYDEMMVVEIFLKGEPALRLSGGRVHSLQEGQAGN